MTDAPPTAGKLGCGAPAREFRVEHIHQGVGFMVYGLWFVLWFLVYGLRFLVSGFWFLVYNLLLMYGFLLMVRSTIYDIWILVSGS